MFVSGSGTGPVLVMVTVCAALVVLIAWFEKAIAAGDTVNVGMVTVPVNGIDCDVAGAATLMLSVWLMINGVVAVGLNVTLMVQVAPTAIGVPMAQLLVCRNMPVFVPPKVMPVRVRAEVPVLVTVT